MKGLIAGVDEVGRGSLIGPVYAAAVILKKNLDNKKLKDSKKLTKKNREILEKYIKKNSHWSIGSASLKEIEKLNILNASLLAMKRAINKLQDELLRSGEEGIFKVLVDGNRSPDVPNCLAIVKGDLIEPVISAASIIAKVVRDRQMKELDSKYPQYGFAQHKGYGTREHLIALSKYGPIEGIHRHTFAPIKNLFID